MSMNPMKYSRRPTLGVGPVNLLYSLSHPPTANFTAGIYGFMSKRIGLIYRHPGGGGALCAGTINTHGGCCLPDLRDQDRDAWEYSKHDFSVHSRTILR
jgi:hypothetical protein